MKVTGKLPPAVARLSLLLLLLSLGAGCGDSERSLTLDDEDSVESSNSRSSDSRVTPKSNRRAGPVENIDASERIAAAKLVAAVDPVAKEIEIFRAEIRGAFDEKDFASLENTAKQLRDSSELCRDGTWKIWQFYGAIDDRFHTGEDGYLTDLETHAEWEKAFPESLTQRIAVAELMTGYAWHARGSGYADTVRESDWKLFGGRLMEANRILQDALKLAEKDPYLWIVALRTALGLGAEKSEFDAIVERATTEFPTFWHVDTSRAYSLLPRWYGEEGDWETYALKTLEREDGLGAEGYVRIVMDMYRFYANVYRDAQRPSWDISKEGLIALREKYPDSIALDNWCAKLGTVGRDREFAKAAFDRLGDTWVEDVWKKPERFVHFRGWALTGKW